MNNNVVAHQTYLGTTLNIALDNATTCDLADLGDVEHFQNFGIAKECFAQIRRQLAGHCRFHIINQIIDDVVVADFDTTGFCCIPRLLVGPDIETNDNGI